MQAKNSQGWGKNSDPISVKAISPPSKPLDVVIEFPTETNHFIKVEWKKPEKYTESLTGYKIEVRNGGNSGDFKPVNCW